MSSTPGCQGLSAYKMTCQVVPAIVLALLITSDYAYAANRICGSRLAEVLAVVCRGRGYYWEIEKRSVRGTEEYVGLQQPGGPETSLSRHRRSVVQECCHRTCAISELESYCNVGDGASRSRGVGRVLGSSLGLSRHRLSGPSSSSGSAASAAIAASRQRFTLGLLSKPFFFVTPRRTIGLLDASAKKK